jgi:hypothetical protein
VVGACELVHRVAQGGVEQLRPVAGAVVGENTFDGDAMGGIEVIGARPEAGRGLLLLVAEHLGVDQSGGVVDGGVQEQMADGDGLLLVLLPGRTAQGAPAADVGDATQLLHIDVYQVAGVLVLVAHRLGFADGQSSIQVDMPE